MENTRLDIVMKKKEYEELVNKWSIIYMKKIGDLFSLEELKQEAWLAILEAEKKAKEEAEDIAAYLSQSIMNKIIYMLIQEIKHKGKSLDASLTERIDTTTPESITESKQIIDKLKISIAKIPHANFVLSHMNSLTVRDISDLAQEEGRSLGKSAVHKIIVSIREEFDKIIKTE